MFHSEKFRLKRPIVVLRLDLAVPVIYRQCEILHLMSCTLMGQSYIHRQFDGIDLGRRKLSGGITGHQSNECLSIHQQREC